MPLPVLVFDIETVVDFAGFARANGLPSDDQSRQVLGDEFPKPAFHEIVAIAAIWASFEDDRTWRIREVKSLHAGEMSEQEMVSAFMQTIDILMPILVSYNGASFDLPVLQWRAILHGAPGLSLSRSAKKYLGRFADHHIDLCDDLAGRDGRARIKLDQACRLLGVDGKTAGVDGAHVSVLASQGKFKQIADYCTDDVAATLRLFYRREVLHNRLDAERLQASLDDLESAMTRYRAGGEGPALISK